MMAEKGESVLMAGEEKELDRVFKRLCNFAVKSKKLKVLNPKQKRLQKIVNHKKRPDAVKIMDADGKEMSESEIDEEYERLSKEIRQIEDEIRKIDEKPEKVTLDDLNAALRSLGVKKKKTDLENMIWEVDENLDGCVDWEEFKLMYERNITDNTGLEPFQLFNVVQFMMYDKDNSGQVSIDETMTMLYQRYGKERLEAELQKLFGEDLKTQDGDGELSFEEYLKVVNVRLGRGKGKGGAKSPSGKGRRGRGKR